MLTLRCEDCFKTKWLKSNKKPYQGRRYWRCKNCGHVQLGYKPQITQAPRELYIDIETAPMELYSYDLKVPSGYINPSMVKRDWFIMSWSAEWMNCFGHKNFHQVISPKDAIKGDDSKILQQLRDLMDEADLIWGHNYKKFDRKKINTRLIVNGIKPPEVYKMIDTLVVARSHFAFASSKLDFINTRIGNGAKHDVDLDDHKACWAGDEKALSKMLRYNVNDVKEGIKMVEKLREWIVPFPKLDKYVRRDE